MEPLKSNEIIGNWGTLLVPIEEDDEINFEKLRGEIDTLISMHVNGIYSNGTAGEFYNQTEDEFDHLNLMLAEKCEAARMPFQIGCSHPDPRLSLSRLKRARELHPSAIQVVLPDWSAPSMKEVIGFLEIMVECAKPVGLVLYNPPHAKKVLTPEEFHQIQQAGIGLVGCKVADGDKGWYARMKALVPDLSLFVPGHHLATGVTMGANGAYSNVACLHPGAAQRWYDMMAGDMDAALEMEGRIQQFMQDHIIPFIRDAGYSNQAADKFMSAIGGWTDIRTRLRWPYKGVPDRHIESKRSICRELLPEFFSGDME
jgi:dihydrodipicolinate synthase/N-acetylneuraminate lyase